MRKVGIGVLYCTVLPYMQGQDQLQGLHEEGGCSCTVLYCTALHAGSGCMRKVAIAVLYCSMRKVGRYCTVL